MQWPKQGLCSCCKRESLGGAAMVAEQGRLLDESVFRDAEGGHVTMWLRKNGCPWSVRAFGVAVAKGRLEALRWMYDRLGPQLLLGLKTTDVERAAHNGHLEVVEFVDHVSAKLHTL
ncbi:hypothetical protein QOT17_000567 [Balamuthia mandrillaris]